MIAASPSESTAMAALPRTAGTAGGAAESLSATAWAFATQRGLSVETLAKLGVVSGTVFFPELSGKSEALFFPYRRGWKARAIPGKAFVAEKGFEATFWNLAAVAASKLEAVYVTEGELDACALVEAGIAADAVLSVPHGTRERPADEPRDLRGYDYVREAMRNGLAKTKRFIWCGDSDGPGLALRDDMARLLGLARFWFVDWPEGCKDANEVLTTEGGTFLRELVTEGSLPWPIEGLYRLGELPEPAPLTVWCTGMPGWDDEFGRPHVGLAPRTLSVVTGQPGHGKTLLWGQAWYQVVQRYGLVACVASFETRPKPHLRRQLRTLFSGALERDMSEEARRVADAWINDRYVFLVHPEARPTLEWFLDMAEVAVVRHGARIVQLDPWNRLEGARERNESETEYIARCLRAVYNFANDLNCHVQIVAHPAKMDHARRGKPPELEDISSSKHWENMVDQGFVVHRPEMYEGVQRKTSVAFYHRKARFEELGHPCKLMMNYSLGFGRYMSPLDDV